VKQGAGGGNETTEISNITEHWNKMRLWVRSGTDGAVVLEPQDWRGGVEKLRKNVGKFLVFKTYPHFSLQKKLTEQRL